MLILRCTAKVRALLGAATLANPPPADSDWYINLLWLERRKCLLLVHAGTLFSVFTPDIKKAELRPLEVFLGRVIGEQLGAEGLPANLLGPIEEVRLAKTASRQILGYMNDMALQCEQEAFQAGGLPRIDPRDLNRRLRRTHYRQEDGSYAAAMDFIARLA